tara:strand:- start:12221 stop:12508 length:288 start_codon:yes stop_codon:yes gene_type:complete
MAIARVFNNEGGTIPDSTTGGSEITEDLTSQVNGQNTTFTTQNNYVTAKIRVYYNGVRQIIGDEVHENAQRNAVVFDFAPLSGDKVLVDYEKSTS